MTDERNTSAFDADETEALRAIGWRQTPGGSSCPDSSVLLAAEEGVFDAAAATRVRAHLAGCATCGLLLKDLDAVLAEAPDDATAVRVRSRISAGVSAPAGRRLPPYIWWGAGLAVAAGVAWFLMMPGPASPPSPETEIARATPPPISTVFVVDRPTIPPGDVDLTVRGESPAQVSLEDQIASALGKADKGDLAGATSDLQGIAGRSKTSRIAALALGAVQLRAGQNADAVATLERARSLKGDQDTADEAGWFLGIALVRTGNADRARSILDDVCRHGGARGPNACAGVAEIDRSKSPR